MLDGRWRAKAERGLDPVGKALYGVGISADTLTVVGLVIAAATAVAIASGHLLLGFFGVILTGLPDLLDGTVARYSGKAGPRGAFFDSVADRVSDALLFGGVAWYLADEGRYLPVLVLAVLALSMLITYERARAESLGFSARGGLMERAERMVFLSIGLLFDILVPMMWIMLVLTADHRRPPLREGLAPGQCSRPRRRTRPRPGSADGGPASPAADGQAPHVPEGRAIDDRRRTRPRRISRVPGRR